MSWDEPGEPDDESFLPPLPQEDRLWRHPSEVGAVAPAIGTPPGRSTSIWAVAGLAGLIGTVFTLGVITLIGGLEPRVVERQIIERVAIPPVATSSVAGGGEGGVVEVADRTSPAIARLEVTTADQISGGSGVLFRSNGYLMTNAHVVEGAREVRVELSGGLVYDATVVGADPLTDIAVVKIEADDLPTAVLGEDVELRVGQPVVAIGSPAGLAGGPSVTTGVVSALGRRVNAPDGTSLHDMIQFDAPITPGSSGGALLDARGAVIGITTAIAVTDVGAEGLGFATPIEIARRVSNDIIETGGARHPLLGIKGKDLDMATAAEQRVPGGALVLEVADGGPAAGAGLEPGDVITSFGGAPTPTMSALVVNLRTHNPGETVPLTYRRGGQEFSTTVDLVRR